MSTFYYNSTYTSTMSTTWVSYNTAAGSSTTYTYSGYTNDSNQWVSYITYSASQPLETEAQKKERIRLEEERGAAEEKAVKLLKEYIGLEKYGVLYQVGYLEMDSQKYAGRKYRVSKNAYSRIEVLDGDKVIDKLCIVPTVQCPESDRLLSKIILLELDEEFVLKTANHFPRN